MLIHLAGLPWLKIVSSLLAVSEGLALMPGVPANGILDALIKILAALKDKLTK